MPQSTARWDRVRFGIFEVDLHSGELRKYGMRIRLQMLPFKLLAVLLEHAGEVVTREELQERIWGNSIVVDFDHSLGTAVNKVRDALGDSAESPRYIETLARRGYRFIAPVEALDPSSTVATPTPVPSFSAESVDTAERTSDTAVQPAVTETPITKSLPTARWNSSRFLGLMTAALLLVLLVCGFLLWLAVGSGPLPSKLTHISQITSSDRVYPGDIAIESLSGVVTDGTRIYFPEIRDGRLMLVHSALADNESYPLVMPSEIARPSLAAISKDGSKFLVQSHQWSRVEEPMWIVPSNGGAATKVGDVLGHDGTWTPDGQSILYASGHDLYLATSDGGNPKKLATVPGRAFWLRYSPDGKSIRLTVLDPATRASSLWQVSADGTDLRPLLSNWSKPATECCGSWTSDGKYFIFQSGHSGSSNLWALNESRIPFTSYVPNQITAGPLEYLAPVPSHQPNRVFVIGARARTYLSVYNAATKQFRPYLSALNSTGRTELSRDGSQIAWINTFDGSLWQSKLDGTQRLHLTLPPMRVFMMRWSPDDKQIAFMGKRPGSPWKIYIVPQDGGNPETVLDESHSEADPCWTPDGNALIFGRSPEFMGEDTNEKAIYSLNLKTKVVSTIPGSAGLFSPRLSPDGRYIAAMPLDQRKLMILDSATNRWSELADKSADNPVWSSDGKSIYFHAFMEEGQPIYRVQISDRRLERIVDFRNLQPAEALEYIGLTDKDEPIILSNVWTANVYAVDWDTP